MRILQIVCVKLEIYINFIHFIYLTSDAYFYHLFVKMAKLIGVLLMLWF